MTITYNWTFPQFDVEPTSDNLTDVVTIVHWILNGTDEDGVSASCYGTVQLGSPDPNDFTSYADITKDQTIEWVSSSMDADGLKLNIANQIAFKKNPPSVPLPPPFE